MVGSRLRKKIVMGCVVALLLGLLSSGGAKCKSQHVIECGKTLGQPIIILPCDRIGVGMSSISTSSL